MRLKTKFVQLPMRFDSDRLREEVEAIEPEHWTPHPQGFDGNDALLLVTVGGTINHHTTGEMMPTPVLERCPYLRQVMSSFGTVVGRSRLMRLAGGSSVTEHADINYYWHDHVRIHVPIVTHPGVEFLCDGSSIHMPPGDAFIFDAWRLHDVINHDQATRIHLVCDTVGTDWFWDQVDRGTEPHLPPPNGSVREPTLIEYDPNADPALIYEHYNVQAVMSPGEVNLLSGELIAQVDANAPGGERFIRALIHHQRRWRATAAVFGDGPQAFPRYGALLQKLWADVSSCNQLALTSNGMSAPSVAQAWLIGPALNPDLLKREDTPSQATPPPPKQAPKPPTPPKPRISAAGTSPQPRMLDRPIIIVGAPRSGSTLLFETLSSSDDLYSLGGEAHGVFESIPELHPSANGFASNALDAHHATPEISQQIRMRFLKGARNNKGQFFMQTAQQSGAKTLRFLEKTPKNALRIPFLREIFPDVLFIYLVRDPRSNMASIMEAWRSGHFVTYPNLPEPMELSDCDTRGWSLLLPEEWRALRGHTLCEVAAFQWASAHKAILTDLADLESDRVCRVSYESFVDDPAAQTRRLCSFIGVPFAGSIEQRVNSPLPQSRYTVSPPSSEKWRAHEQDIEQALGAIAGVVEQLGYTDSPVGSD